ncbi:MAG: carboxypeptidase regulatory-like domain-containing protein [Candidatus Aenigmatarchaeota archaeon]|nr:MAG: carboxypeptidase regulatory-like domain-containing protein [Candidatus Aenigmarchaeota archaeon]
MGRKGQVEFIVILGLLVVIAVVVFYAYQSGILGPVVSPDVSLAEESVRNLIRTGAYQTLNNMSLYGGYLNADSFQLGSLTFNGREVPYWQKNGQIQYPDLHSNFKEGVKNYLLQYKDGFANAYTEQEGKELIIGEPSISANFLNDKIDLLVNMPTTLDGNTVPQPYSVSIPTRFEETNDFSTGFLTFSGTNRPLEYFTLGSMLFSPIEDGEHDVPFYIHLTQCGDMVYKDWFDVKNGIEYAIKTTLAHTYMPGKYPTNVLHTTSHPKYSIPPINGNEYENIDITFHLPDDFELNPKNLQFTPSPIFVQAEPIPMTTICDSDPMFVQYYIIYPTIVRVKDPLTGNSFQFATEVFIFNNTPGDWGVPSDYLPSPGICENPGCSIDITVRDSDGNSIPSVSVTFMNCLLGRTDSSGRFLGSAPCGIGPLEVYKQGFGSYKEMKSSDDIEGLSITLSKTPAVNLHFYEVEVQNITLTKRYKISSGAISYINTRHPDEFVNLNFYSYVRNQFYQRFFNNKIGRITAIPADVYYVSGTLISDAEAVGGVMVEYILEEELDGKDLYVYLPYIVEFGQIEEEVEFMTGVQDMTRLLEACGLGPIRDTPVQNFGGCSVGYNEL